jgi:hypothetical protein
MANQIFPDEGLQDCATLLLAGGNGGSGNLWFDIYTAPSTAPTLASAFAALTLGVQSGAWTAASANSSGTNLISPGDGPTMLLGHLGIATGQPVTFTNTSGGPLTVYGSAWYDASAQAPPNEKSNTLLAIQALDVPVVVPNGGTIVLTPILFNQSVFAS